MRCWEWFCLCCLTACGDDSEASSYGPTPYVIGNKALFSALGVYTSVGLRNSFPWTYALWRLINSRPIRIVLASCVVLLLITSALFRIESSLFQRRVRSLTSRIARLRLDQTSEQELRQLLPEMNLERVKTNSGHAGCADSGEEGKWLALEDNNAEKSFLVNLLYRCVDHSDQFRRLLYVLGHRFYILRARVRVREGKVDRIALWLMMEAGGPIMATETVILEIKGYGCSGWEDSPEGPWATYKDIAPYSEHVASNRPETALFVKYTPDAPEQYIRRALDVRLDCLWNFLGCQSTKQVLPGIWSPEFPWRP